MCTHIIELIVKPLKTIYNFQQSRVRTEHAQSEHEHVFAEEGMSSSSKFGSSSGNNLSAWYGTDRSLSKLKKTKSSFLKL